MRSSTPVQQSLPVSRVVPAFKFGSDALDEIEDLMLRARGTATESVRLVDGMLFPKRVELSVSQYLSEKAFEESFTGFRKQLKELRQRAGALETILPTDGSSSPFRHLRSLYCYGQPDPEKPPPENENFDGQRVDRWDLMLDPSAVRATLRTWIELIDGIPLPRTKAADVARERLVGALAAEWRALGLVPANSRSTDRQDGYYAEFVRIVARSIAASPHIPKAWWPGNLNHYIRRALEKPKLR